MLRYVILSIFIATSVKAHEMVPTYPKLEPSYIKGLQKTSLTIFNKRPEVEFYEIGVFTKDWKPLPFKAVQKKQKEFKTKSVF